MAKSTLQVAVTPEFKKWLQEFADERNISQSRAFLILALVGAESIGLSPPPAAVKHGGDRTSEEWKIELERMDIELLGLPPLADDD